MVTRRPYTPSKVDGTGTPSFDDEGPDHLKARDGQKWAAISVVGGFEARSPLL